MDNSSTLHGHNWVQLIDQSTMHAQHANSLHGYSFWCERQLGPGLAQEYNTQFERSMARACTAQISRNRMRCLPDSRQMKVGIDNLMKQKGVCRQ